MAQNYTEQLRKDNVRDAIYEDLQNNCEVLRTSWSGNAFPANPKVGQPCYRVDEDKLYYWDGYKWSQKGGGGSAELKSMELPAIETERVSIILEGARCLDKNMMFVFVDKIAQDPSTYSLNDDGTVVNFNPAIPANAAVTLRWFDTDVGTFDTAIFASDAEFAAGELTNRAPNVKQVRGLTEFKKLDAYTAGSSDYRGLRQFIDDDQQTDPDSDKIAGIDIYKCKTAAAGNDGVVGYVTTTRKTDGTVCTSIGARQKRSSDEEQKLSWIEAVVRSNGTCVAQAPTPPSGDSSNAVPTTKWVNDAIKNSSEQPAPNTIGTRMSDFTVTLESGIVTVKAGASIEKPDGSFVVLPEDKTISVDAKHEYLIFYRFDTENLISAPIEDVHKAGEAATNPNNYGEIVVPHSNTPWPKVQLADGTTADLSLPICHTKNKNLFRNTFDLFGYYGNVIFARGGTNLNLANGKTNDGTYSVASRSVPQTLFTICNGVPLDGGRSVAYIQINSDNSASLASSQDAGMNEETGYVSNTWRRMPVENACIIGTFRGNATDGSTIRDAKFRTKPLAGAYSRNDIIAMSQPSPFIDDLVIAASGSRYSAPADGWFWGYCGNSDKKFSFTNLTTMPDDDFVRGISATSNANVTICPARYGDVVRIDYSGGAPKLRFIYADGEYK